MSQAMQITKRAQTCEENPLNNCWPSGIKSGIEQLGAQRDMIRMSIQSTLLLVFITVFSTQALAETCETNPGNCTPVQLCEKSTEVVADKTYWTGDETNSYLKVARQFGLDCGALDALSSCQQDADECGIEELCKIATTLTGSKTSWNQDRKNHVELRKVFWVNLRSFCECFGGAINSQK
jgi:hypothetical protein